MSSKLQDNQILNSDIPRDVKRVLDPHHGGSCEWCYFMEEFWIRNRGCKKWTKVSRTHLTIKRLKLLYSLLPEDEKSMD